MWTIFMHILIILVLLYRFTHFPAIKLLLFSWTTNPMSSNGSLVWQTDWESFPLAVLKWSNWCVNSGLLDRWCALWRWGWASWFERSFEVTTYTKQTWLWLGGKNPPVTFYCLQTFLQVHVCLKNRCACESNQVEKNGLIDVWWIPLLLHL